MRQALSYTAEICTATAGNSTGDTASGALKAACVLERDAGRRTPIEDAAG